MTVTLNPFEGDQTALVPIGTAYSVTLGKMLDAGKTVDDSYAVLPYIRAANIQDDGLRLADVNEMPFSEDEAARLDLRRGDLLVVEGGAVGTSTVLDHDMPGWSFQKTVNRVRPLGDWSTRYLGYVLRAYRDAGVIDLICNGSTISHLTAEKLRALRIPSARPGEQRAIADYLDRETARIDTLIEEQQRLIEILRERRRTVLVEAICRGISSSVTLVPSEVGWIGDVPSHWKIVAIKWLTPVKRGASPRPIDDPIYFDGDGEWAWVRIADVSSAGLSGVLRSTSQTLSELGSSLSVKIEPGELFVSIAATVGKPCITSIKCCIHDGFVYFPDLHIEPWWLFRIFEAGECYRGLGKLGTQLNLNTDTIGGIKVPVPQPDEIQQILAYIEEQTAKIDTLIEEIWRFIELVRERRGALITAAVTGQIDVRKMA